MSEAQPYRVLLRCDGDNRLGMGHVMESLWLARALEGTGVCCTRFLTAAQTPGAQLLLDHNCDVVQCGGDDLDDLRALVASWKPDAVVVSLFGRDAAYYRLVNAAAPKQIAVFDDGCAREDLSPFLVDYCVE